jgi:lipid II:glycine glycyltransferase (peptidoglycan interpeptide bridge formation enzyme)
VESYINSRAQTTKTMLILRAELKKDRVAAMLFLIHGSAATYHVGWSNEAGRDSNAHNLLLWRAFDELRERGVRTLDLGGINTRQLAGISRFKIGSGGKVVTYAGTFI